MRPASSSDPAFDEKEQLLWTLPSSAVAAASTRPASALPAYRAVPVVSVGGERATATADTDSHCPPVHAATAWRALTSRRPHTATAVQPSTAPAAHAAFQLSPPPPLSSSSSRPVTAPFNASAARFAVQDAFFCTSRPATSPPSARSTAAHSAPTPPACSPSHSRLGYTVGFVSKVARFPRSRCSRPSPGSYQPAVQPLSAQTSHHAALAYAAFHSANHNGQHLPPQPSQPRVTSAPATATSVANRTAGGGSGSGSAAHSPPSVPFVSPYFLRRPTPAPNAYSQQPPDARALRAVSIGQSARPSPFGSQTEADEPNGSTPSAASYQPLWQATRPSSSNAASVHFTSLTQRMAPQQSHDAVADALRKRHAPNSTGTAQAAVRTVPHRASLRRQQPQDVRVVEPTSRLSYGAGSAESPSPAEYSVRLDSSRPYAPHHSFAPPVTQPPASGVAALTVTRGGPGLHNHLTSAGREAEAQRVARHTAASSQPSSDSPQEWKAATAGLTVDDTNNRAAHHSFHFNQHRVWMS